MDLSALWLCLNDEHPNSELFGWTAFLRDNLSRITEAMGPNYDATKRAFDSSLQRQAAAAVAAEPASRSAASAVRHAVRAVKMRAFIVGPLGWILAAVLLLWVAVK